MLLVQIGEVLCRYEVEKKLAIDREDYDIAKEKKVLNVMIFTKYYTHSFSNTRRLSWMI